MCFPTIKKEKASHSINLFYNAITCNFKKTHTLKRLVIMDYLSRPLLRVGAAESITWELVKKSELVPP